VDAGTHDAPSGEANYIDYNANGGRRKDFPLLRSMRLLVGSNHDEISRFGNIKRAFGSVPRPGATLLPQSRQMLRAMPEKQRTKLAKQPALCHTGQVTKAAPVANTGKPVAKPANE
jgi:hypothetical protein